MDAELSSSNLFDNFGLTSSPAKNEHKYYDSDGEEIIAIVDEVSGSPAVSNVAASTPKQKETVNVAIPMKFLNFLKRIAPQRETLDEQLNYLMNAYDESERSKSEQGFTFDSKPNYELNSFVSTFDGEIKAASADGTDNAAENNSKMACFNCDGEHSVNDCPEPRDHQRINRNRLSMRLKQQNKSQIGPRRYGADNSKYSQYKPGVISDELRRAVGLKQQELPLWIYQMRNIGYPPGHLMEAMRQPSNLMMFDDNHVPMPPAANSSKTFYDPSKIIEYPGFNVPLPPNVLDNCMAYHMPPMLPFQEKHALISRLNSFNDTIENYSLKSDNPRPPSIPPPPLPPASPPPGVSTKSRSVSPTETDLQKEREAILAQLAQGDGLATSTDESNLAANESDLPIDSSTPHDAEFEVVDEIIETESISTSPTFSRSLSVALGTPTMTRTSGGCDGSNLKPSLDKFRQGVNEFEPHEETPPCRGGGMKKMKEILQSWKKK